ncbi:hypothetical protein GH714_035716 [Hevea brasiliensis]|uniref:Uncharacterized protein n=1 Tax=Hevea brasiliensis TaxID=3981 RepID=A0A6A6M6X8_HEVBR|nr:hypothetical protein GH714_035716 [Hevea brasiliensis]
MVDPLQDLDFSFLAQLSNSSSAHLIARSSDTIVIVAKNQLHYLLSIELGSHTEEQRSLFVFALSTLITVDTPFQDTLTQAKEGEDRVKAIRGKVVDLEDQISHLKAEITELKAEEASLMQLEINLLVDHMIDRGMILSKGETLRELAYLQRLRFGSTSHVKTS